MSWKEAWWPLSNILICQKWFPSIYQTRNQISSNLEISFCSSFWFCHRSQSGYFWYYSPFATSDLLNWKSSNSIYGVDLRNDEPIWVYFLYSLVQLGRCSGPYGNSIHESWMATEKANEKAHCHHQEDPLELLTLKGGTSTETKLREESQLA